jgi:hypothetical protein
VLDTQAGNSPNRWENWVILILPQLDDVNLRQTFVTNAVGLIVGSIGGSPPVTAPATGPAGNAQTTPAVVLPSAAGFSRFSTPKLTATGPVKLLAPASVTMPPTPPVPASVMPVVPPMPTVPLALLIV